MKTYFVNYGPIANLTECRVFDRYHDALEFYNELNLELSANLVSLVASASPFDKPAITVKKAKVGVWWENTHTPIKAGTFIT